MAVVGTSMNEPGVMAQLLRPAELRRRGLLMAATVLVLTFLAPWGTDRLPPMRSACGWLAMVVVWEVAIVLVVGAVLAWRRRHGRQAACLGPGWTVAIVMIAAVPAVPLCLLATFGHIPSAATCAVFTLNSVGLGAIISLLRTRWRAGPGEAAPEAAAIAMAIADGARGDADAFLARHAPHLAGARLLALEAEDHYLRIHTDAGDALVLLRLRDAVEGLGAESGLQVHRSFWVARDAAPLARRRGQAWALEFAGGLSVPVSRANVAACRAEGWL